MRLSIRDKKVIDAFVMERPLDGKILFSDGKKLEKFRLMVGDFAKWVNGKIHIITPMASKSDEMVLRYLIKKSGKGMVRFDYGRKDHAKPIFFYDKKLSGFLHSGNPITVYHGTYSNFKSFDAKYMREKLLNQPDFVGNGFFFTISKRVAEKYADSRRNSLIFFDEVFPILKKNLPREIYEYAVHYYHHGWDDNLNDLIKSRTPRSMGTFEYFDSFGLEINTLFYGIIDEIEDSHGVTQRQEDALAEVMGFFNPSSPSSGREEIASLLEEIGINGDSLRPKIYTCKVRAENVKLVKDLVEAKRAWREGYDAIVWAGGDHLIEEEPEVVIYNPKNIHITKVEVIRD
jgi:hypothetical protein